MYVVIILPCLKNIARKKCKKNLPFTEKGIRITSVGDLQIVKRGAWVCKVLVW
jgi:hypothetical protein